MTKERFQPLNLKIFANKPKPYIIAHGGNQTLCPENTLAAFKQAVNDGADIIEADLRLTADDEFVCIHDATVDRTTGGHGEVAQMKLEEIKKLNQHIPTLSELADITPPNVALALELKTDRFWETNVCRALIKQLEKTKLRDRTIVVSFSSQRLQTVYSVAPDIPSGLITFTNPWPSRETQLLGPFWPMVLLNPIYTVIAHRRGQLVCPLDPTPDSRLWLYRLLGCDAVITNNPGATIRKLGRAKPT